MKDSLKFVEQLHSTQRKLDELTRDYILEILKTKESAETQAKKLLTILNSFGEGLIVWDKDMNLVLANQAVWDVLGTSMSTKDRATMRQSYAVFKNGVSAPLPINEEPLVIAMNERRVVRAELLIKGAGLPQEGIWIKCTAAPVFDDNGEVVGGVTVVQNINERIKLARQRDALLSLITHDLKNHFAAEYSLVEMLLDSLSEKLDDQEKELLQELRVSSEMYGDLGQMMLEVFRTDINDPAYWQAELDLEATLRAAVQLDSMLSSIKQVKVDVQIENNLPPVRGIFSAWRQVFHNLLQNAIEASPPGSSVSIKARCINGRAEVTVSDCGCGMSESELKNIFEPNKFESSIKSAHSTGVGLYLCHFLVEAQHGRIQCLSTPGKGTTFVVELPGAVFNHDEAE